MVDNDVRARLQHEYEIEIREKTTDQFAEAIAKSEANMHECRTLFNEEILRVESDSSKHEDCLPGPYIDLIYRRCDSIRKKAEAEGDFRVNYDVRDHPGTSRLALDDVTLGCSPSVFLDTKFNPFTDEQMQLLRRGPTYVAPCQTHLSSSMSMQDAIQKQFTLLSHHLNLLFSNYKVNTARSMFLNKQIKDVFTETFSIPMPSALCRRAKREQRLIKSIRQELKGRQLTLRRTADQRNVFYLGNRKQFDAKAEQYLATTDAFEMVELVDDANLVPTQDYLLKLIKSLNRELEMILSNSQVHKMILKKLIIDSSTTIQLPYLYFLPDISKVRLCLRRMRVLFSTPSSLERSCHGQTCDHVESQRHISCSTISRSTSPIVRRTTSSVDDIRQRCRFHAETDAVH